MMKYIAICILSTFIASCTGEKPSSKIIDIGNTAQLNSQCSRLVKDNNENVYMSWVELQADTSYQLLMSPINSERNSFQERHVIAQGRDWFVNWADMPGIYPFNDGSFIAYWLEMSSPDTYDYDIKYSIGSPLSGWGEPSILHNDGIAAEHGFVSITPYDGQLILSWLDGRMTKIGEHDDESQDDHGHGHTGAMTLRTATIDANGNVANRAQIDQRICDCCQTDIAVSLDVPIVVYRDRSEAEIRDIYMSRLADEVWTEPRAIHADYWKIYGCPVNGPAIAALDSTVAVAWYTEIGSESKTQLKWSKDGGTSYSDAIEIGTSNTLGRVDIELISKTKALVTWMESENKSGEIIGAIVNLNTLNQQIIHIAQNSPARKSGFPKILYSNDRVYLSYTDAIENVPRIKTVMMDINE